MLLQELCRIRRNGGVPKAGCQNQKACGIRRIAPEQAMRICPRCGKETETTGNPFRPFCSERCKLLDLGNWITGTYRIPATNAAEDEDGAAGPPKDSEEE